MSDEPPDAEEIDLSDRPEARYAYRAAHELSRRVAFRAGADSSAVVRARDDARRELARLRLRGLDPAAEARLRPAIEWCEADGITGAAPLWRRAGD